MRDCRGTDIVRKNTGWKDMENMLMTRQNIGGYGSQDEYTIDTLMRDYRSNI